MVSRQIKSHEHMAAWEISKFETAFLLDLLSFTLLIFYHSLNVN